MCLLLIMTGQKNPPVEWLGENLCNTIYEQNHEIDRLIYSLELKHSSVPTKYSIRQESAHSKQFSTDKYLPPPHERNLQKRNSKIREGQIITKINYIIAQIFTMCISCKVYYMFNYLQLTATIEEASHSNTAVSKDNII
jgi:hypothetical protein